MQANQLLTIGYTGMKPPALKEIVERYAAFLIDIRYSPRSRVPYWNRAALYEMLPGRYLWAQQLGNVNFNKDGPIKLSDPEAALRGMRDMLSQWPCILLCACEDWRTCHRKQAAELLSGLTGERALHLDKRGRVVGYSGNMGISQE